MFFKSNESNVITKKCRHIINLTIVVATGILFLCFFYVRYDQIFFHYFDAYDYAQLARNIAEGNFYKTKLITPLSWSKVPRLPHPEFWRPPLYPLLVASGFLLAGINSLIPKLISSIAFIITGVLTYGITNRISNASSALFSGLFLVTCAPIYRMGVYGLTESTYIMLMMGTILVISWEDTNPYLLGFLGGLTYLTRFNGIFLILTVIIVLVRKTNHRLDFILDYSLAFLITLSPWLLRNLYFVSSPIYNHQIHQLLSGTAKPGGWEIFFYFDLPDPIGYAINNPWPIFKKWVIGLHKSYNLLFHALRKYYIPLVLSVLWLGMTLQNSQDQSIQKPQQAFRVWSIFIVTLILQTFVLSAFIFKYRLFIPFLPLLSIFAGITVNKFIENIPLVGTVVLCLTLSINIYFLLTLSFPDNQVPKETYQQLKEHVPQNELLLSNKFFFLPWYTDRNTLAATASFSRSEENYPEFNYVFLHEDSSVRASGRHKNIIWKYQGNPRFNSNFRLLKKFTNNQKLFIRRGYTPR